MQFFILYYDLCHQTGIPLVEYLPILGFLRSVGSGLAARQYHPMWGRVYDTLDKGILKEVKCSEDRYGVVRRSSNGQSACVFVHRL